jgi:hypothetical protein
MHNDSEGYLAVAARRRQGPYPPLFLWENDDGDASYHRVNVISQHVLDFISIYLIIDLSFQLSNSAQFN